MRVTLVPEMRGAGCSGSGGARPDPHQPESHCSGRGCCAPGQDTGLSSLDPCSPCLLGVLVSTDSWTVFRVSHSGQMDGAGIHLLPIFTAIKFNSEIAYQCLPAVRQGGLLAPPATAQALTQRPPDLCPTWGATWHRAPSGVSGVLWPGVMNLSCKSQLWTLRLVLTALLCSCGVKATPNVQTSGFD